MNSEWVLLTENKYRMGGGKHLPYLTHWTSRGRILQGPLSGWPVWAGRCWAPEHKHTQWCIKTQSHSSIDRSILWGEKKKKRLRSNSRSFLVKICSNNCATSGGSLQEKNSMFTHHWPALSAEQRQHLINKGKEKKKEILTKSFLIH